MIVVDANVITYLLVASDVTAKAEALARVDPAWIAPPLWRFEVTSALTTLVRAKAIAKSVARDVLSRADELMSPNERLVDQRAVLEAALRFDISAHDAQYVALAEARNVKCVTADRPLLLKTSGITLSLDDAIRSS